MKSSCRIRLRSPLIKSVQPLGKIHRFFQFILFTLCTQILIAQQHLGHTISQLAPFDDHRLNNKIGRILLHMDAFSADSSMRLIGEALQHIDLEKDKEAYYYLLCFRAEVLYYEGLFHEGIRDLDHCEELAIALDDSMLMANVFNLKGLLHENIQDSRMALPHLRKALAWFPRHAAARYPASELHHIHGNIGSYLTQLGELDSASYHLQQSLMLAKASHAKRAVAVAWWSLGNLALRQDLADSALVCYGRAAEEADLASDHDIAVDALVGKAGAFAALGDERSVDQAISHAIEHLEKHADGIGLVTQRNAHRLLAKVSEQMGRPDMALVHMGRWFRIDSMITARNIHSALQVQGDLLRSDADLAIERLERERVDLELERVRNSRTWIIAGSLIVLLIFLGNYASLRSRQRARQRVAQLEMLRIQQEATIAELRIREEIGRDMHDDLGAGLSALKLRSEMALRKESDTGKRLLLEQLATTAGELIVNMRQMIWTMNDDQSSLADLVAYIGNYARTYLDDNGIRIELAAPEQVPEVMLSAQQRRNLLLVVKEALHNIVKHANATAVVIAIDTSVQLTISIMDNGKGLPHDAQQGIGNGLRNMARRMQGMGGSFHAESGRTQGPRSTFTGTRLQFHLPLPANKGSIAGVKGSLSTSLP